MKLSLKWISDYVALPANLTPEQLAYDLTMTTVEVDKFEVLSETYEHMVVGKVTSIKPHPNADRLRIAMTDLGSGVKQIVCGGTNLKVGMLVAVAPPGARVRWHGEGDPVTLKEAKIRGEQSFGMICASNEVGLQDLFPALADLEIIDLTGIDARPGTPLATALELDDIILEIDNKSLTNRPDLWGHYGMAREIAAIYSLPLKELPRVSFPRAGSKVKAEIHDKDLCRRYTATSIDQIEPGPAPLWMRRRLASVGQRPISLIVDLTNYVMLAIGQPTHAFDSRELTNNTIHIRRAKAKEGLELLDGSSIELTSEMLVIADDKRAVALAGIMGGKNSGIRDDTTAIVLESGNFDAVRVRKTASRLGVRTESSIRFEKSLDCDRTEQAAHLFVHVLQSIQPRVKVQSFLDVFPSPFDVISVSVGRDFIVNRIGTDLKTSEIKNLLLRLGFQVDARGDALTVRVPPWRATGDVSIPADIVEEVARLHGYENLEFIPPPVVLTNAVKQPQYDLDKRLREYLAGSARMVEVFNYPWVPAHLLKAVGNSDAGFALQDPPSPDLEQVAQSLIPNLLGVVEKNMRNEGSFGIFEVGRVFSIKSKINWSDKRETLPYQPKYVSGMYVSADAKDAFFQLKGKLEELFSVLQIEPVELAPHGNFSPWTGAGAQLAITAKNKQIGEMALVSPKTLRSAGIERISVAAFEFSLDDLIPRTATSFNYKPIPKFPQVDFDLAMVFDVGVLWSDLETAVLSADTRVKNVSFSNEYQGEQIPTGKKSIAFEMVFGDDDKTMTSDEVQQIAAKVMSNLEKKLGAVKRDR